MLFWLGLDIEVSVVFVRLFLTAWFWFDLPSETVMYQEFISNEVTHMHANDQIIF
jgi:hypothetical protein